MRDYQLFLNLDLNELEEELIAEKTSELEKRSTALKGSFREPNLNRRILNMEEDKGAIVCFECQEKINLEDDTYTDTDQNILCEHCYFKNYASCNACEEVIRVDDSCYSEHTEGVYCEDCYNELFTKCYNCDVELVIGGEDTLEYAGDFYCSECFYELYSFCANCNDIINNEYLIYDDASEEFYCECCYDGARNYNNIKEYEYKPAPDFKYSLQKEKQKRNTLYFGLELEVENSRGGIDNDSMAEQVEDFIPDAYCKIDNSLSDGFEIVTHPYTWNWYQDNKENFNGLLEELTEKGFSSFEAGTCGIHIHLSKNCFSTLHLFKFLKMFYDKENFPLIFGISQRTESSSRGACQWGSTQEEVGTSDQIQRAKAKDSPYRYTAINLENRDTVEVRIFRGTLNKGSFHKNMEFVKAIFEFTLNTSLKECSWVSFSSYIKKNYLSYGNLFKFMEKKNLFV